MSEHARILASSGNGSASSAAATGTYPTLVTGKAAPETGNNLPIAAAEVPEIESLVHELNTVSRNIGRDLRFEIDLEKGRAVIQVLDRETGELIRQIPHENAEIGMNRNGSISVRLIDAMI